MDENTNVALLSIGYLLFVIFFFGGLLFLNDLYDEHNEKFAKWRDRILDTAKAKLRIIIGHSR